MVDIPAEDVPRFVGLYYPVLRQRASIASSDGSVTFPDVKPPRLALWVRFEPGHRALPASGASRYGAVDERGARADGSTEEPAAPDARPGRRVARWWTSCSRSMRSPGSSLLWQVVGADAHGWCRRQRLRGPAPPRPSCGTSCLCSNELPRHRADRRRGATLAYSGGRVDAPLITGLGQSEPAATGRPRPATGSTSGLRRGRRRGGALRAALRCARPGRRASSSTPARSSASTGPSCTGCATSSRRPATSLDPETGGLRLSAHHADLWDELVALGVVDEQSARWAANVEALARLDSGPPAEAARRPPADAAALPARRLPLAGAPLGRPHRRHPRRRHGPRQDAPGHRARPRARSELGELTRAARSSSSRRRACCRRGWASRPGSPRPRGVAVDRHRAQARRVARRDRRRRRGRHHLVCRAAPRRRRLPRAAVGWRSSSTRPSSSRTGRPRPTVRSAGSGRRSRSPSPARRSRTPSWTCGRCSRSPRPGSTRGPTFHRALPQAHRVRRATRAARPAAPAHPAAHAAPHQGAGGDRPAAQAGAGHGARACTRCTAHLPTSTCSASGSGCSACSTTPSPTASRSSRR